MGAALLLVVAAIYGVVAVDYALNGRWGMALSFIAYAIANVGFALDAG